MDASQKCQVAAFQPHQEWSMKIFSLRRAVSAALGDILCVAGKLTLGKKYTYT
jgi:hypothetical protein